MARLRSTSISVIYAGKKLFDPTAKNNTLADSQFNFTRNYTTASNQILDSPMPIIRAHGNASGTFPLSVCYDFPDEDSAYEFLLSTLAWCDENQTGTLEVKIGDFASATLAGLTNITANLAYMAAVHRVTVNYSFLHI